MNAPLEKLQQIPTSVVAVEDYEALARERVSPQVWAYIAGGAEDEWTIGENRAAFQRLTLRSRVLREMRGGHTQLQLFGQTFASPIMLAPIAYHRLAHPEGEVATALAASATQTALIASTQGSVSLEEIARNSTAPLWFQLYIQHDREFTVDLMRRAEAAGYRALVVTVDAPVNGLRNREKRVGTTLPTDIEAVNLRGMRRAPPQVAEIGGNILLGGALLASAPTWADLGWLKSQTSLPIVVKGIMTAEDADEAIATGIAGIIVSNHGGRTLDTQPATITVLPEIAEAVGGRVPLLLDGGIRRGSDVFKALALGADAALIGRPYMYGLAAAGMTGVAHVMQILRAELEMTMALTGCNTLADIDASRIRF
ncbi:MAG: lldD [Tardiphaga sp.]|jgi:4-hydroxymandelate oxidase|nr:lldD [Tardiphaga sp.]